MSRRVAMAGGAMILLAALVAPSGPVLAAPGEPNDSCDELMSPALDTNVVTTVSASGVTVSWNYGGAPSYARACVWPSGTQDAGGVGAIDRALAPGTTSRFFSWADFGLAQSPCITTPGALFRGGVHIATLAESRRGTFANCPEAEFFTVDPVRLLDTREANGLSGAFAANTVRSVQIGGRLGIPGDALAITGNLTVVSPTRDGYVSVGPTTTGLGTTSSLNFPAGDVRANGVTLSLGPSGKLNIVYKTRSGGTTHILLDVTGYYRSSGNGGATFHVVDPARVLDTREGLGLSGKFRSATPRTWQITGSGGVPAGATAITANVTVVDQTRAGYVSLGPVAISNPTTSTINFPLGDTRANGMTVKLSGTGSLSAVYVSRSSDATTDLVVDVTGYFTSDSSGAHFVPLEPSRVLDTRVANGLSGVFVTSTPRSWTVGGRGGVSASAVAVVGNVTVVGQTRAGFVSVTPVANADPATSTINFPVGDVRANGITVKLGALGKLSAVYKATSAATTHLIFDAFGFYR